MAKQSKPATTTAAVTKTSQEVRLKPELLPADLGGGDIQFIKRSDYAKRTAETFALKLQASVTKAHVVSMLEALDAGKRDMPDETPEELVKVFGAVTEDYDDAVRNMKEEAEEEERIKREEEEAKAAKAKKEEGLMVAVQNKSLGLSSLADMFDTGNMDRFIPKGKVSDELMLEAFNSSLTIGEFSGWMQGDLIVELEKRGLTNVVSALADKAGKSYAHLYNNARTAKAFPPETRKPNISFTIYREVGSSNFTEEQKKQLPALLKDVAEGKHTSQSIRKAVQEVKGKVPAAPVAPEDDTKKEFLLIDPGLVEEGQLVTISKGFPKELVGGGVTIIDMKTGKRFTSFAKKGENRWEDVPAYAPPEPEPEPVKKGKGKK